VDQHLVTLNMPAADWATGLLLTVSIEWPSISEDRHFLEIDNILDLLYQEILNICP
jgi:hypothetical protein